MYISSSILTTIDWLVGSVPSDSERELKKRDSAGLILHDSTRPFLVQDSISTFSTTNNITRTKGILCSAVTTDVLHRLNGLSNGRLHDYDGLVPSNLSPISNLLYVFVIF